MKKYQARWTAPWKKTKTSNRTMWPSKYKQAWIYIYIHTYTLIGGQEEDGYTGAEPMISRIESRRGQDVTVLLFSDKVVEKCTLTFPSGSISDFHHHYSHPVTPV